MSLQQTWLVVYVYALVRRRVAYLLEIFVFSSMLVGMYL